MQNAQGIGGVFFCPIQRKSHFEILTVQHICTSRLPTCGINRKTSSRQPRTKFLPSTGIQRQYKEGKITQARYGIEEVETHYCTWLGGLEDREHPWRSPYRREQHMADLAMEETLAYALDVDGFREVLHVSSEFMSDDKLLEILHHRRARSKHIPVVARLESEQWIKQRSK